MRTRLATGMAILVSGLAMGQGTWADEPRASADQAVTIAAEGYVYGYPLVLMDISRQVMTAVASPNTISSPANQFNVSEEFPDPSFTSVVSPNADTLYSFSWLDLTKEPIVLSLPEMGDRYYLMQMLDAWTNVFASPGTRTTGNHKGDYAVTGPHWTGTLPDGLKEIKSPTCMVWVIGRTQTNGKADYEAVRAIKKQYKLTPLSAWGQVYTPPNPVPVDPKVNTKVAPVVQIEKLTPTEFFTKLAALMKDNPPSVADKHVVEKLAKIGVVAGQPFDADKLAPGVLKGIEQGVKDARVKLATEAQSLKNVKPVNGWAIALDIGRYGIDYRHRAVTAVAGLGANLPEDAVYPMTGVDGNGKPLTGANKYTLRFPKGQLPPVNAFWSLTMYNSKRFFVENPLDRYAIGDRDKLKFNEDGSLTLYIQNESPGPDKESNWLPAPKEGFNLIIRLYWPKKDVLDGTWQPPAINQVE